LDDDEANHAISWHAIENPIVRDHAPQLYYALNNQKKHIGKSLS